MRVKRIYAALFFVVLLAFVRMDASDSGPRTARAEADGASSISGEPMPNGDASESELSVGVPVTVYGAGEMRDTLSVSASVSPSGMVVPAEAQVYLTLANGATEPISDIWICQEDGTLIHEVGTLSGAGKSSVVYEQAVTPTKNQLRNGGVYYLVKYTLGKGGPAQEQRELKVLAPIAQLKAEPKLEFTRSLSANYAQIGEEVCITYRLRNTGNVALTDLVLQDELCGEIVQIPELLPGKKTTVPQNVVINETSHSKPKVTYNYPGHSGRLSESLDPLTIYQADGLLEAHLDADRSAVLPGELVTLQLKLTNRGNVTYDKLEISDQVLGSFGTVPVELKPGDDYVFVKRLNLKSTTTFLFSVSGKSGSGSLISAASNMMTVAVSPAIESIKLSVQATVENTTLSQPGNVNFSINIHNGGEMDIRNVRISERTLGKIKDLAVVAPGDNVIPQQFYVEQDQSFVFMAELTDANGGELTVYSKPQIDIKIGPSGALPQLDSTSPESTAILGLTESVYRMNEGEGTFQRMVWGVAGVLGVLLAALFISLFMHYNQKRKQRKVQLKKLRKSRRNARLERINAEAAPSKEPGGETGVYRKADLVPNKTLS